MKIRLLGYKKDLIEFEDENGLEAELLERMFHAPLTLIRSNDKNVLIIDSEGFWRKDADQLDQTGN